MTKKKTDDLVDDCYYYEDLVLVEKLREAIGLVKENPDRTKKILEKVIELIKEKDERDFATFGRCVAKEPEK